MPWRALQAVVSVNPHCALIEKRKGVEMKKIIFLLALFLLIASPYAVAEDTGVCGKSYMMTVDHELYLMKFSSSTFGPDCSGNAVFLWGDQKKTYPFQTTEIYFIKVTGLGEFVLRNNELIFLEPDGIRLTEY